MIALRRIVEPVVSPVTAADVKAVGRITTTAHDGILTDLIVAATAEVENICSRALITQTWEYVIGGFCGLDIDIPRPPLKAITSIQYRDVNGDSQTLSASVYQVATMAEPAEARLNPGYMWPAVGPGWSEPVTVTFMAGYGDTGASIPTTIRQCIIALVVHWYDNGMGAEIPTGIRRALDNYRITFDED